MKKNTYAAPVLTVRGDVMEETLGFKKAGCGESSGRKLCSYSPAVSSFDL
jgi:hypothetical protein